MVDAASAGGVTMFDTRPSPMPRTGPQLRSVINAIVEAAKSGKVGDGKVFATPINEAVRIRTGETGESAL